MSGQATGISGISVPATGMPHFVSAAPVRPASPARVSVLEAAEAGGPREQSELLRFQQSVMARSLSPHRQNPEAEKAKRNSLEEFKRDALLKQRERQRLYRFRDT